MTYFPLRQITCFFIPLVAPCKPLLEYRYADKVQRNDRQLCPPGFERAFRHLTRLQKTQTSGYNRAAGVGLPARDKSEFEGGRNNEYRENREERYHLRSCSQ